jgi:ribosomal protein S18 acetylase RimI-like enzyme
MSTPLVSSVIVTPFARRSRHLVRDLLSRNFNTHVHLDWQDTDHWITSDPPWIRLAWMEGTLVGVLGLSPALERTSWVRLAGVLDHVPPAPVLSALWADVLPDLRDGDVRTVAMLMIRDWPIEVVRPLGFTFAEQIVTLRRADQIPPADVLPEGWQIRPTRADDIPAMTAVDHAAFVPPWQMSMGDIYQAEKVGAHSTVVLAPGEEGPHIVGYQISTMYFDGAHLARLAVHPSAQGQGVGTALVAETLRYFARRGLYVMTVNTQMSNAASHRVYERLGFRHNGYDLPVWMSAI